MQAFFLVVQTATFVGLGSMKFATGDWRLGAAQFALAGVTVLVYA